MYEDRKRYKMSQWEKTICKYLAIVLPTMLFIEWWWYL